MKVINIGSLNIDYVYDVEHLVQRGETISSFHRSVYSGGKGLNQSIALKRAGMDVYHAGMIGKEGLFLKELLQDNGVDTEHIKVLDTIPSGHAIIQRNQEHDNGILLYGGANQALTLEWIDQVLDPFDAGDLLILQNEVNDLNEIVEKAHQKGLWIALNPSPMDEKILDLPLEWIDFLILNEIEARFLLEQDLPEETLMDALAIKFPHKELVLTLGAKGSVYQGRFGRYEQPSFQVPVVDTTGAGDTFLGFFLAGWFQGLSIERTMKQATKAASLAIQKNGAAPSIPTLSQLK